MSAATQPTRKGDFEVMLSAAPVLPNPNAATLADEALQQSCDVLLDAADRLFEPRSSSVLLRAQHGSSFVVAASRPYDCMEAQRLPVLEADAERACSLRQAIFASSGTDDTTGGEVHAASPVMARGLLIAPLICERAVLGVLVLRSPRCCTTDSRTATDLELARAIAAQGAAAICHARRLEQVERELAAARAPSHGAPVLSSKTAEREHQIIGDSPALRNVLAQIAAVEVTNTTVLLIGETGTGKEVLARAIWKGSPRRHRPYVALNCAALPESLVESELFGYEKGAFTGAFTRTPGKFEVADSGTLLLDEIGDLPLAAQAKLLRVLQEREVQRVGGGKPVTVDVRVIAATNQDLVLNRTSGRFREDLFYRLAVFPIHIPPLRERREDIPLLANYFVRTFGIQMGKRECALTVAALDRLVEYNWPGNVRELQNVVQRALLRARGEPMSAELIQFEGSAKAGTQAVTTVPAMPSTAGYSAVLPLADAERDAIVGALKHSGWRISGKAGAAEILGLKPTTLHSKMKKLGIRRPSATGVTGPAGPEPNPEPSHGDSASHT